MTVGPLVMAAGLLWLARIPAGLAAMAAGRGRPGS